MVRTVIILLLTILSFNAWSTGQDRDGLWYEGKDYALYVDQNPLEQFFYYNPKRRPEPETILSSRARGYQATFSIKHNALFIEELTITKASGTDYDFKLFEESVLGKVFPDPASRRLDWFAGVIVVPLGEELNTDYSTYIAPHEKYLLFRVSNGSVIESAEMSLKQYQSYRKKQFEIYKKTKWYRQAFQTEEEKQATYFEDEDDFDIEDFIYQVGIYAFKVNLPFSDNNEAKNNSDVDMSKPYVIPPIIHRGYK